jgi:hypothetical protein
MLARNGGAASRRLLAALLMLAACRRDTEAGIQGLGPLLLKEAPGSAAERTLQDFQGKKLAIDASMAMYQFLIAVRVAGRDGVAHTLTSDAGDDTSHLQVCRKIARAAVARDSSLVEQEAPAPSARSASADRPTPASDF